MILQATHTHLYPGHRGRIADGVRLAGSETCRDCLVEFADGSAAAARITAQDADWLLQVDAYRTAAGTRIAAKRWLMRIEEHGDRLNFRILARQPDGRA